MMATTRLPCTTVFPDVAALASRGLVASPNRSFADQVADRLNGRCRPVLQVPGGADALARAENPGGDGE